MYNDSVSGANTSKYLLENIIIHLNNSVCIFITIYHLFAFLFLVRNFNRSFDKLK